MQTLAQLLDTSVDYRISSGISRLDTALSGGKGFKSGIYDISTSISQSGLGCYEILFNVLISVLERDKTNRVLFIQSINKVPWMKLKKSRRYNPEFNSRIDCIDVNSIVDVISLFQKRKAVIANYTMVVVDSYSTLYSASLKTVRKSLANLKKPSQESSNEPIYKFFQSCRKLFHLMQQICTKDTHFIFTTGAMDIYNQRVMMHKEAENSDDEENKPVYINQQILVPTVSLKSDINSYFNNRIILYRDWVLENSNHELVSGLNHSNPNIFQESVNLLNTGNLKCLPHFLCINIANPISNNKDDVVDRSGYFLIDNNFQIMDIQSNILNSLDDDDIEIPDSQEW